MGENKEKQGLVFIPGVKILMDFLCFYCVYGYKYSWTLVCREGRNMNSYVLDACNRTEIFDQTVFYKMDYREKSTREKLGFAVKILFNFVFGRRKKFCEKIITDAIPNGNTYDLVVVPNDYEILYGAYIRQAKDVKTAILEDGQSDYIERKWKNIFKFGINMNEITGFTFAILGYANTALHYPLNSTKNCIKYVEHPEKLTYQRYKSIYKLDFKNPAYKKNLDELMQKAFVLPKNDEIFKGDVLLFTSAFDYFTDDESKILKLTTAYLNENFKGKKVIIKKHPADQKDYLLDDSIEVVEIDKQIPAEILSAKIKVKECLYMFPSTLISEYAEIINDFKILFYDCLNKNEKSKRNYQDYFYSTLADLPVCDEKIIHIGCKNLMKINYS